MEKVYLGCMLQTKKKYCGMMYTSPDQKEGVFEAKGIETIRKDQCRMTQTILQGALITLFQTADKIAVRRYLNRQWTKLLAGRLPISDFILTGRVRTSYREGGVTTAASLVKRLSESDPMLRFRNKQRISFVIVAAPAGELVKNR